MNKIKYTYGLTIIESISQFTGEPYSINFYLAQSKDLIGVFKSHGATYKESREYMKSCLKNKNMGLDITNKL